MNGAVEAIKSKLDIVEVVSSYLKLEAAGQNWKARCPFHNEKTASFFVSPARQSYHCFGCHRGGDVISFVEDIEGLDFMGALRVLAERAGIDLGTVRGPATDQRERQYAALEAATRFYEAQLEANGAITQYLTSRGLRPETIRLFRLGFAPDGWTNLWTHLSAKGYRGDELEAVGLVARSQKATAREPYYDRFRRRVMFPFEDGSGRIIGFSGRIAPGGDPSGGPEPAKYVNSPETELYDKSRYAYGWRQARAAIRRADRAVLVEGQLDLLLAHQAGTTEALAVSGTALTAGHLEAIGRLSKNLVLAFDGDSAGQNASKRAIALALEFGFDVRVAALPAGVDPADLIQKDPAAWTAALAGATHVIDFFLNRALESHASSEARRLIRAEVLPLIARLESRIDQAYFVRRIAERLGITEDPVWQDLRALRPTPLPTVAPATAPAAAPRTRRIEERLWGLLLLERRSPGRLDGAAREAELRTLLGEADWTALETLFASRADTLALEAEVAYGETASLEAEWAELLANLKRERLRTELGVMLERVRTAERSQDPKLAEYLQACQDISKRINDLRS